MSNQVPHPPYSSCTVYSSTTLFPPMTHPWVTGSPGDYGQVSLMQLVNAGVRLEPMTVADTLSVSFNNLPSRLCTPTLIFAPPRPYWLDQEWTGWFRPILISEAWRDNGSFINTPLILHLVIDGVVKLWRRCAKIVEVRMCGPMYAAFRLTIRLTREEVEQFCEQRTIQEDEAWTRRVRVEMNPAEYSLDFASEETMYHIRTHFPTSQPDLRESVPWSNCRECQEGNHRLV